MADLLITESGNTKVSEAGVIDTYKLQLASAPTAPVTVTLKTDRRMLIADPDQPLYRPLKIMPIGDSITYGVINSFKSTQSGGYRTYLWRKLNAQGYTVDFVGSQTSGPRSIDRDHEGYRGKMIDGIAGAVGDNVAKRRPDVVLLLAGTNDVLENRDLDQAPQRLQRFVSQILHQAPQATVLVGALPPNTRSSDNPDQIEVFNTAIARLIHQMGNRKGEQVKWVDLFNSLSASDLADRTHPTAQGYQKMARAWYSGLLGVFHSSTAMSLSHQQTFTFTPRNWQTGQTVTVVAHNNQQATGSQRSLIVHQTRSADADYNDLEAVLPVRVVDDDAAVLLMPLEADGLPVGVARYQVQLSSQPDARVTVQLTSNRLRLNRSKLTFRPDRWQQPQMIRVKARESGDDDRYRGVIRYQVRSQDFSYQNLGQNRWMLPVSSDELENDMETDRLLKSDRMLNVSMLEAEQADDLLDSGRRNALAQRQPQLASTNADASTIRQAKLLDNTTGFTHSSIGSRTVAVNIHHFPALLHDRTPASHLVTATRSGLMTNHLYSI